MYVHATLEQAYCASGEGCVRDRRGYMGGGGRDKHQASGLDPDALPARRSTGPERPTPVPPPAPEL